jgi:hypothetical protein
MASECKKCSKILASFIDPRQAFGPDKIIPPQILANAKVSAPNMQIELLMIFEWEANWELRDSPS